MKSIFKVLYSVRSRYLTSPFTPGHKKATWAILGLSSIIIFLLSFIHWYALSRSTANLVLDLRKNWSSCRVIEQAGQNKHRWSNETVILPDNVQKNGAINEVTYRNTFKTPLSCTDPLTNGCVFYVGGVYQGLRVRLNGHSLGTHFTHSNLYPASFQISHDIWKANETPNEIEITVYTKDKSRLPAIVQGPIGIIEFETAQQFSAGIIGERILLPIVSASIDLSFALIAIFWLFSKNSPLVIVRRYIFFCVTTAAYMLNVTRFPREF